MLTTKSLICISLILLFAVGDEIAPKPHGKLRSDPNQYLNAGTVDGAVSMAANTDAPAADRALTGGYTPAPAPMPTPMPAPTSTSAPAPAPAPTPTPVLKSQYGGSRSGYR